MPTASRNQRQLLLAVFVLSGFAGLIYQSIWSHYIGLFLGHAAYAQALVLALFMGGMALGAAWIAKAGEGWHNLIRTYALIELVIGLLGLTFHPIFKATTGFGYDVLIPAAASPWAINLVKWTLASLLILPQTILLGMTFPLMSGGLIRRFPGQDGHLLGGLYFTNSAGAALGALCTAFLLLPALGLPGTSATAGVLNLVVASLAWWLSRAPEHAPTPVLATTPDPGPKESVDRAWLLRAVLWGTFLSGAASFVYEIVWIRMLSLAVGSTMHAFELMLASFIAGIALGGLWIRKRADRTPDPLRMVGWMQIAMGVAALASLVFYANAFEWVGWLMRSLSRSDGGYALFNLGTATISILIMLPAAFFAGTTLPLFTVTLLRAGFGERSIGRVYAWNTMGAIVGVFAAIHLLIPLLGLKLALCAAALVDMLIGLALLRWRADSRQQMTKFAFAGLFVSASLGLVISRVPFDPMKLASGVFRNGDARLDSTEKVVFYRDGKTASVSVITSPNGIARIATNGKVDAAIALNPDGPTALDEPTMTLAASLPLAIHPDPERVGVIGFGSGMTTHTLLADPRVQLVDTVEIEQAMILGAAAFGPRVERAFNDPRSNIVIDDAKAHFAGQPIHYDVLISEPSNPWISGVGSLFSKEFYSFVPRHLADDGLFVQWVQLYEINEALVSSILNAMTPEFGDYAAWLANHTDLIIVATPGDRLPEADYEHILTGVLGKDMQRLGLDKPELLAFRKVADARLLRAIGRLHGSQPNSDFYPLLSLRAPAARFRGDSARGILSLPFAPIPFLESIGIREPLGSDVQPPAEHHYPADSHTLDARALTAVLRGDTDAPKPSSIADHAAAQQLLQVAGDCNRAQDPASQAIIASRLFQMAGLTIPFLTPDQLQDVWINPGWMCPEVQRAHPQALDLIGALAARDYAAMDSAGRAWLARTDKNQVPEWSSFNQMAVLSVMLAAAHENRWSDIARIDAELGSNVSYNPQHAYIHGLMLALADE